MVKGYMKNGKVGGPDGLLVQKGGETGDSLLEELKLAREKAENVARLFTDLYVEIYNFSPAGYFRLDKSGRIIELNINGSKMLERDRSELLNKIFTDFITTESKHVFARFLNGLFGDAPEASCELKIMLSPGSYRYLLIEGILSEQEDKCLLAAIDISDRKRAEMELMESERNFRNLFEYLPIGLSMTSLNGGLRVNLALSRLLGYSREELQVTKWMDITHPDDIRLTQDAIDSLLHGGKTEVKFTKRFIHKSGKIITVELSSYLHRDEGGVPRYLMTAILPAQNGMA